MFMARVVRSFRSFRLPMPLWLSCQVRLPIYSPKPSSAHAPMIARLPRTGGGLYLLQPSRRVQALTRLENLRPTARRYQMPERHVMGPGETFVRGSAWEMREGVSLTFCTLRAAWSTSVLNVSHRTKEPQKLRTAGGLGVSHALMSPAVGLSRECLMSPRGVVCVYTFVPTVLVDGEQREGRDRVST